MPRWNVTGCSWEVGLAGSELIHRQPDGSRGGRDRAESLEARVVGGTVGPPEVPFPNPNVPEYASRTKTLRNYPTPGALF